MCEKYLTTGGFAQIFFLANLEHFHGNQLLNPITFKCETHGITCKPNNGLPGTTWDKM